MLRITEYIRDTLEGKKPRVFNGVILIWNLTNVCNLYCKHCYSSANQIKDGELSFEEIKRVVPELKKAGVKIAILSGGEPLMREDIYEISEYIKSNGIMTYLSTNGLLIDENNIDKIKEHFNYLGISIDGKPEMHDLFRGKRGAYEQSMKAIRLGLDRGIKVGLRYTFSSMNAESLPYIFELVEKENIPKLYISHLVYTGRGNRLSSVEKENYKKSVQFIIDKAFEYVENNVDIDIVTGNHEADAVMLYKEFSKRYPELSEKMYERLKIWGGNSSGERIINIDFKGNVKPDTFYFDSIGNVREKPFYQIFNGNGLLSKLREHPRKIKGKCSNCEYIEICNGSSRPRSYAVYGDYFMEDPACYI